MKKNKIMAIILSGAMIASVASGVTLSKKQNTNKVNKPIRNNILLSNRNQAISKNACVINGDGNLVLTNKDGKVVSYLSVGEMLKVQSTTGNRSLVTVQETGATGYISNSNILSIHSGDINNITRMNRSGYIINVSNTVNLRKGPSMNDEVLTGLTNNTPIRITGKTGQWYRVSVNGTKGYVFEEYVGESNSKTTTAPKYVSPSESMNNYTNSTNVAPSENHNTSSNSIKEHTNSGATHVDHNTNVTPEVNHNNGNTNVDHNSVKPSEPTHHTTVEPTHKDTNTNTNTDKGGVINTTPSTSPTVVTPGHDKNPVVTPDHNKPSTGGDHGSVVKPVKPEQGGEVVAGGGNGSTVSPSNPTHKGDTVSGGGQTVNPDNSKPDEPIHDGSTNPSTPVASSPTVTAHNLTVQAGHEFDNTMLGAKANQDAKITYTGKVDTNKLGTYDVQVTATNAQGKSTTITVKVSVVDQAPVLTGHNYTIPVNGDFSYYMLGMTAKSANGVDLTSKIEHVSGVTNNQKPGDYKLTFKVTDQYGMSSEITLTVTVKAQDQTPDVKPTPKPDVKPDTKPDTKPVIKEQAPVLNGSNVEILQGSNFDNSMLHASATVDGNAVAIKYVGTVNTNKPGTYTIKIEAVNSQGTKSEKDLTVTVKAKSVVQLPAPVITGHNVTLTIGQPYADSMLGASATVNGESGTVRLQFKGNVDTNKPGNYQVTVIATNAQGKTSEKEFTVSVNDKAPTLIVHNYEMTQGGTFSLNDLNITATSANGTNIASSAKIIAGSVNTNEAGTYTLTIQVTDQFGESSTQQATVTVKHKLEAAPVVNANNITLTQGQSYNNGMLGATSNEANAKISYAGNVDVNTPGIYHVKITAINQDGRVGTKTVTVTIKEKPEAAAVISGHDITITQGANYSNSMLNVSTNESDATIQYQGNVDANTPGNYQVTVIATNGQGVKSEKTFTVTVKAPEKEAPAVINANDITIEQGAPFNNSMLHATTNESDATLSYSGNVNNSVAGTYNITITATNKDGVTSTKEVTVTVKAPVAQWQWINKETGIGQYKGVTYYTQGSAVQEAVDQAMFNDINALRAQHGLKAFKSSEAAQFMAQWKSTNCDQYGYYEHVAQGAGNPFAGKTTNQVFQNQANAQDGNQGLGSYAENLGACNTSGHTITVDGTTYNVMTQADVNGMAQGIVDGWKASPLHLKNMLSNETYMGVYIHINLGGGNGASIATMSALTPPIVGGTFNPVTGMFDGGHTVTFHFTEPTA